MTTLEPLPSKSMNTPSRGPSRPRSSGYTLRSSPLAGPAIATISLNDGPGDGPVDLTGLKTRTGATPSRISVSHTSNVLLPGPSQPVSESCTFTSHGSTAASVRSTSLPRDRHSRPHSRSRTTSAPALPSPDIDYGPFTVAKPDTHVDPWLTDIAPPTFSRRHSKGVIMPVKAPRTRRPQTAPATLHWDASSHRHLRSETVPLSPPPALLPDQMRGRSTQRRQDTSDAITVSRYTSDAETGWTRKRRRRKSLMSMSMPPGLGEVREEREDEDITEWGKLPLVAPSEGLGGEALAKLPSLQSSGFKDRGRQDREGKWTTTRKWPWRSFLGMLLKPRVNKGKSLD